MMDVMTQDGVMTENAERDLSGARRERYGEVLVLTTVLTRLVNDPKNEDIAERLYLVDPIPTLVRSLEVRTTDVNERFATEGIYNCCKCSYEHRETVARHNGFVVW